MASRLGFTAYYSRNIVKWFAVGVVLYLIGYIIWVATEELRYREPPPPPINVRFEIVSAIQFPPPDPGVQFSYKLETITGELPPPFSDRGVVFQNNKPKAGFYSFENNLKKAKTLRFDTQAIPVSPPIYRWRRVSGLPALLELNVATNELDMVSNWQDSRNLFLSTKRIGQDSAFRTAQSQFARLGLWNESLKTGDHKFTLYKIYNNQLLEVPSIADADIIQVNFRRAAINGLPVVHADPERPPVWALVTREGTVLELHYHFWNLGPNTSEYPLRSIESAYKDLVEGRAHIARIGENVPGSEVIIRDFSMAYYVANDWQGFTEPVYVIRGDDDFTAYVQAIDRGVIGK